MARRQSVAGRRGSDKMASELRQLHEVLSSSGCGYLPRCSSSRSVGQEATKSPVSVFCRFRGQSSAEEDKEGVEAWELGSESVNGKGAAGSRSPPFHFDRVFGPEASQVELYEIAAPSIADFLGGLNCAILCYGQTSAGKTFTMAGTRDGASPGLVPRMLTEIFDTSRDRCKLRLSMLEIYQERLRDLLSVDGQTKLRILEDRAGEVETCSDALSTFWKGTQRRTTAPTGMNDLSSRSHCVFIITAEKCIGSTSKFYFVDLAGSESVKKVVPSFDQDRPSVYTELTEESKSINQSLSTLGLVLNRLVERRRSCQIAGSTTLERRRVSVGSNKENGSMSNGQEAHVPFRSSKLTRVLQDVLSGNTRTSLIINCSISSLQAAETLSTLRFGQRARSLVTSIKMAQSDATDDEQDTELTRTLCAARQEIQRLRLLTSASPGAHAARPAPTPPSDWWDTEALNTPTPPNRRHQEFMLSDAGSLDGWYAGAGTPISQSDPPASSLRLSLPLGSLHSVTMSTAIDTPRTGPELSPLESGSHLRPALAQPQRLNFLQAASSTAGSSSTSTSPSTLQLPLVPPSELGCGAVSRLDVGPVSWDHPLTKSDFLLRAMAMQEQSSQEAAARLSVAEAELEWMKYLAPCDVDASPCSEVAEHFPQTFAPDSPEIRVAERQDEAEGVGLPLSQIAEHLQHGYDSDSFAREDVEGPEQVSAERQDVIDYLEICSDVVDYQPPEIVPEMEPAPRQSKGHETRLIAGPATPLEPEFSDGQGLHEQVSNCSRITALHSGGMLRASFLGAVLVIGCSCAFAPSESWLNTLT